MEGTAWNMVCYCILTDHLQNWSAHGYSLVIFLILALFWLSERGQFWGFHAFSGKPMEEMAWNFACWCILTTFRTDWIMVTVCRFFSLWCYFDLVKRVKFGVSRHLVMLCGFSSLWWPFGWNLSYLGFLGIIWRTCGSKCREVGGGIFPTLCFECCLLTSYSVTYCIYVPGKPGICFH